MEFRIEVTEKGPDVAVLAVDGEIDLATAPRLKEALLALAEEPKTVIVDLSKTQYLDSTALGVLVGGLKRKRERGGELRLAGLTERVRRVFDITRLSTVFEIYSSVEEAKREKKGVGGAPL
jgi:anti-sigma B factor antagonist